MKILVFTGYYLPGFKGGGPIKTIKNLIDALGEEVYFKIITSDRDLGDNDHYMTIDCDSWNTIGNAKVFYIQSGIRGYKKILRILGEKKYDIVYLNSFFSVRFSFIPILIARNFRKTVVLAPRGEFSKGALSHSAKKKYIFVRLYKILRLHKRTTFQVSSDYEAEDVRRMLGQKVDIHVAENIGSQEFGEVLSARTSNILKAVFLSRISPKKNLLVALEMLQEVKHHVSYHIYGPIEDQEYWAKCEVVIKALPANIHVVYRGELHPKDVVSTLSKYDAFFMPTKGENYGHVIAEALCAGLPLLIADTTPWRNLQEKGVGWDLPLSNIVAFSNTIDQLALMSPEDHYQMRKDVLAWAKDKFSQRDAIDANIAMFEYAASK